MKTRPRIRRATLWGGLVVSVALVVVWAMSMVWSVDWRSPGLKYDVSIGYGRVAMTKWDSRWDSNLFESRFTSRRTERSPMWWCSSDFGDRHLGVEIPLWMPLVVSLGVTAAAWRLEVLARRRARAGKCASCGYDRAGLKAGAVCPECGAAHGFVSENR